MEATITKRRTSFVTVSEYEPKDSTYQHILGKINAQKRLVAEGKMEKPQPVNGFTLEDWRAFESGISIEDYALKRAVAL
jgi:hypothetical protein